MGPKSCICNVVCFLEARERCNVPWTWINPSASSFLVCLRTAPFRTVSCYYKYCVELPIETPLMYTSRRGEIGPRTSIMALDPTRSPPPPPSRPSGLGCSHHSTGSRHKTQGPPPYSSCWCFQIRLDRLLPLSPCAASTRLNVLKRQSLLLSLVHWWLAHPASPIAKCYLRSIVHTYLVNRFFLFDLLQGSRREKERIS